MIGLAYILQLENMTSSALAEKIGVTRSLVTQWVNGRKPIPDNRLIEINRIFPLYPAHYIRRPLSEADVENLKALKSDNERVRTERRESKGFKSLENLINEQIVEQQSIVDEVSKILNISEYNKILENADKVAENDILLLIYTVISSYHGSASHDYKILNKLEAARQLSNLSFKQKGEDYDYAYNVVSVTLSALSCAFGMDDDLMALVYSPAVRSMMPNYPIDKDPTYLLYSRWRNQLIPILKEMIDCERESQRKMAEKNAQLNAKLKANRDGNPEES